MRAQEANVSYRALSVDDDSKEDLYRDAVAANDWDSAIQILCEHYAREKGILSWPDAYLLQAFIARAKAFQQAGAWQAALSDLSAAIEVQADSNVLLHGDTELRAQLERNHAEARWLRGTIALAHGLYEQAVSDFSTHISNHAAEPFLWRGRAFLRGGNISRAVSDFQKGIAVLEQNRARHADPKALRNDFQHELNACI